MSNANNALRSFIYLHSVQFSKVTFENVQFLYGHRYAVLVTVDNTLKIVNNVITRN